MKSGKENENIFFNYDNSDHQLRINSSYSDQKLLLGLEPIDDLWFYFISRSWKQIVWSCAHQGVLFGDTTLEQSLEWSESTMWLLRGRHWGWMGQKVCQEGEGRLNSEFPRKIKKARDCSKWRMVDSGLKGVVRAQWRETFKVRERTSNANWNKMKSHRRVLNRGWWMGVRLQSSALAASGEPAWRAGGHSCRGQSWRQSLSLDERMMWAEEGTSEDVGFAEQLGRWRGHVLRLKRLRGCRFGEIY